MDLLSLNITRRPCEEQHSLNETALASEVATGPLLVCAQRRVDIVGLSTMLGKLGKRVGEDKHHVMHYSAADRSVIY